MESKKVKRGESFSVYKDDQLCVSWKDNKAVYMATNKYNQGENFTAIRYSREEKKRIEISVPDAVKHYNQTMGGVDLLDGSL